MVTDTIKKQIAEAMKAKDEIRLSTLKLVSSELHNAKIDKMSDLTEEEEVAVIKKEAKKRKDAIELYKKGGADDKAKKEEAELAILSEFLPEEMGDEELGKIVESTISEMGASSMADMGKVMGAVMGKVKGQADGNRVSGMVKQKLS